MYDEYTFVPNGVTDRPPVLCFQVGFWFHRTYLHRTLLEEGLEGRTRCAFDMYLGAVALVEPSTKRGPEVFTPGGQMRPLPTDTLLLHHEAYVVKGARVVKVALDVGYTKKNWSRGGKQRNTKAELLYQSGFKFRRCGTHKL